MSDSIFDSLFFLNPEMALRWTITLLHFLWQGCVIGVVATAVSRLLKNHAASSRYGLHAVALLACPICVAATFSLVTVPADLLASNVSIETGEASPGDSTDKNILIKDIAYPTAEPPVANSNSVDSSGTGVEGTSNPAPTTVANSSTLAKDALSAASTMRYRASATRATVAYGIGVACFLLRVSIALWGGHRLRANSAPLVDSALLALVRNQAQHIGLRLIPVVAYCERVAVPTVIGVSSGQKVSRNSGQDCAGWLVAEWCF